MIGPGNQVILIEGTNWRYVLCKTLKCWLEQDIKRRIKILSKKKCMTLVQRKASMVQFYHSASQFSNYRRKIELWTSSRKFEMWNLECWCWKRTKCWTIFINYSSTIEDILLKRHQVALCLNWHTFGEEKKNVIEEKMYDTSTTKGERGKILSTTIMVF